MSSKEYKIIDKNLFSGSNDAFRTAVGGFWDYQSDSEGTSVSFTDYNKDDPLLSYFAMIASDPDASEPVSTEVATLNKKIPMRIMGASEVTNDKLWEVLFMGGTFGEASYSPLYNEKVFGYHHFDSTLPYPKIDASALAGNSITNQIEISYDYNNYLPEYENYIKSISSELLIPNYYLLADLQSYDINGGVSLTSTSTDDDSDLFNDNIINFVTLEGNYPNIDNLFIYDEESYPTNGIPLADLADETKVDRTHLTTKYLSPDLINNPLSDSTETWIKHKFQNIFLDETALSALYDVGQISQYEENFPFFIKINFPTAEPPVDGFVKSIVNNKYTARFLKTLKECFAGEIADVHPVEKSFVGSMNYLESSELDSVNHAMLTTKDKSFRMIDYSKMLAYTYSNYDSVSDNSYFLGGKNVYREGAYDTDGVYRYINTISSIKTYNDAVEYANNEANFEIDGLDDILYEDASRHNEVLAYRIEKVGGKPAGDGLTQDAIQNYWIINSPPESMTDFTHYDTQVKYDRDYTYNVYAYVLVVGARYNFSDLRLTKAISLNNYNEDTERYGLEFYDPKTGEKVEQLYTIESQPTAEFTNINSVGTLVQEHSRYPYLADFYLNCEPDLKIIEVPVYSKTLRIMDNPANGINVFPYQHLDMSQKIGFELKYDAFIQRTFPNIVEAKDQKVKEDYINARDLFESSLLSEESISRPRYIHVYRTTERPTSYNSFDNKLIRTIDTINEDFDGTYTSEFFDDTIKTNQKYYYLFRMANEQLVLGQTSEIYEAQLINDGGYLYSIFNVIHEDELKEKIYINPLKKFKKLVHIQPNISQLTLNTTNVDFEQTAGSQLVNLEIGTATDLIWNKTFKLRLTSKKTGKKIDLNITYKLN